MNISSISKYVKSSHELISSSSSQVSQTKKMKQILGKLETVLSELVEEQKKCQKQLKSKKLRTKRISLGDSIQQNIVSKLKQIEKQLSPKHNFKSF